MPDLLTLTGVVATPPRHITTNSGLEITSFRLASSQRRYDREHSRWVETETNWYTVSTFRQLAVNLATSVQLGQHVLVTGRLRVRAWENGEKSGTTVEVEADSVGHDLCWGTSAYTRSLVPGSGSGSPSGTASIASGGESPGQNGDGHEGWAASAPEPAPSPRPAGAPSSAPVDTPSPASADGAGADLESIPVPF
ncbi:MAG: single-stranded DNA-binding protein [Herbiconiux sp.]|nr:single-stranded DNA-binding protein [Herbiconiux sp.]